MAIVQNPITGRTRKKFGTAVFSKHYENNTMRSRPIQVDNPEQADPPDRIKSGTIFFVIGKSGLPFRQMLTPHIT